jgi:type II secretory pathway pseudopilin PulG
MSNRTGRRKEHQGFIYVSMIVLVFIVGLTAAMTVKLGAILSRRSAESELLLTGAIFIEALSSYADATEPGQVRSPNALDELLRDQRFPGTRRHLRQIYVDPITGTRDWGLIRSPENSRIVGIYSQSGDRPIKLDNFSPAYQHFKNKSHISEWKFLVSQETLAGVKSIPPLPELKVPPLAKESEITK